MRKLGSDTDFFGNAIVGAFGLAIILAVGLGIGHASKTANIVPTIQTAAR